MIKDRRREAIVNEQRAVHVINPDFFLRGLVIGFSIAAPVGPIGVLCIRRTLAKGRLYGLTALAGG